MFNMGNFIWDNADINIYRGEYAMNDEKLDFFICGTFRKEILERISELEKNSLPKVIYEGLIKANVNGFNKHVDEIAELKLLLKIQNEINLKNKQRFNELKEVLRETMLKLELVGGYMCSPTQFKHIFDDIYWKNKAKLDGDKEKSEEELADWILEQSCDIKTEKKEPINDLTDNSWKEIFKETEFTVDKSSYGKGYVDGMKDSGGEKEDVREGNALNSGIEQSATDSKPPEPNSMLDDLKEDPAFRLGREYERKQIEPREDLYTCRLCGNEITLVEHEVSKLTVEVQREDLEKWKKIYKIIDYHWISAFQWTLEEVEIIKSFDKTIKEAYGIK